MTILARVFRSQSRRLAALAIVAVLYVLARPPEISRAERAALAERFHFVRAPLPELAGSSSAAPGSRSDSRLVRPVHPSFARISAWISSVGAAVALGDLDGDGLPNDLVWVDTRRDQVLVAPVPGTETSGHSYAVFELDPGQPATVAPMGCLPGDLNEDGLIDVVVYYWGRPPLAFLRRQDSQGPGRLAADRYVRCELAPSHERWFTNAAVLADLDGDGHADLVIGNYFDDDAEILDPAAVGQESMQHSMSRAFNAGRNRLLRWVGASAGPTPAVSFLEARGALENEVALGWTLAVGAADLDGDLLPELYFANDFGPDRLLHNRSTPGQIRFARLEGIRTLTTPRSKVLGRDSFKGMGVDFADVNGDGWLDIYVSNIAARYALLESHFLFLHTGEPKRMLEGIAPFVDQSERLGLSRSDWSWDARLGDFDNDGVPEALQATGFVKGTTSRWPELQELAMGNDELLSDPQNWPRFQIGDDLSGSARNYFFVRSASGRYFDLAGELGLMEPGVSRGIATADVDGDGKLDFAVANQWAQSSFYRNRSSRAGGFLGLHLLVPVLPGEPAETQVFRNRHPGAGIPPGRPAVGASVRVYLPDPKTGPGRHVRRVLVAQVDGGNGHSGKRSPDLHFGLGAGQDSASLAVEIRWRDPRGRVRQETHSMPPGWHTVVLGWPKAQGSE
jgi:enediyne biosynthesis protein E4